jgi:dTDP-4-dehydrorhamnose reductase
MTKGERVLITGCGGMLGKAMYEKAVAKYGASSVLATDIDLNETWLSKLDVRNIQDYEKAILDWKPTIILHLAALTDLEYCESNVEEAWHTNALGPENAALLCRKYDILLVYISTAGIFGGEKDEYADFDTPNPLSYYAKSKYHGEQFIEKHLSRYYIFRAGWMMGGGMQKDKKFVNKIYKQIKSGKKELFVVDDKLGTPTYTVDFSDSLLKVIESGYYGLYNQVCEGSCSRFDVAEEFVKLLGLTETIKVTKVTSNYFKEEYYAPRPASEKLINVKLAMRGINYMRDWHVCLAEYSQEYKKDFYGTL